MRLRHGHHCHPAEHRPHPSCLQPSAASAPIEASFMVGSMIRWEEGLAATDLVGSDRGYNSSLRTGSSSIALVSRPLSPRSVVRLPPSVIDRGTQPIAQLEATTMEAKRGTTPSLSPCRCCAPRLCRQESRQLIRTTAGGGTSSGCLMKWPFAMP